VGVLLILGGKIMQSYILRRILQVIPVLLAISLVIFMIINLAPGDPLASLKQTKNITQEDIDQKRESLGLDDPLLVRYFRWLKNALQGDLGRSLKTGRKPISQLIANRLPATLLLAVSSMFISWVLAIPIGVFSALKQYSFADYSITVLVFIGLSLPSFFFGIILVYIFALKIPILPIGGMVTPGSGGGFFDILLHLILPAFALGIRGIASLARYMRSSMLEVINEDYIRTAKAKGLTATLVIYKHAFRNALIPIITIFGLQIPWLISGSIITEKIFTWPGMGTLSINAVFARDYPVIMATNMFYALMVFVGNLIADISYAIADPRIRYD